MSRSTMLAPVVTMVHPDDSPADNSATVGTPLPQIECRIVDPVTGDVAPVGQQGEMCVCGFSTMIGYFDMPEVTAATLDSDGWLHTGDLCTMGERGYVMVTGRLKDMIIRGGENVYPVEVEGVILAHPAVVDVAVAGRPSDQWGEIVAAVVRTDAAAPPPSVDELRDWCRERLARHKTPTEWSLAKEFPLTGSGKVQKYLLRDQLAADALRPLAPSEEVH